MHTNKRTPYSQRTPTAMLLCGEKTSRETNSTSLRIESKRSEKRAKDVSIQAFRETVRSDLAYSLVGSVSAMLANLDRCAVCEKRFHIFFRGRYECASCMKFICSRSSCTAKKRWIRSKIRSQNLHFRTKKKTYRVCTLCAKEEEERRNNKRLDKQSIEDFESVYSNVRPTKCEYSATATKVDVRAISPLMPVYTSQLPDTPHVNFDEKPISKRCEVSYRTDKRDRSSISFFSPSVDDPISEICFNFWRDGPLQRREMSEINMTYNSMALGNEEKMPLGFSGNAPETPRARKQDSDWRGGVMRQALPFL